jgi:mono/diheme cytochrome c family protein
MNDSKIRFVCFAPLAVLGLFLAAVPARAQDAAGLYKSKCAACHGADGSGNTAVGKSMKLRDLRSADVQKQTGEELTAMITNGKGAMPAYKDKLTSDQIKQLVEFIRQLAKKT